MIAHTGAWRSGTAMVHGDYARAETMTAPGPRRETAASAHPGEVLSDPRERVLNARTTRTKGEWRVPAAAQGLARMASPWASRYGVASRNPKAPSSSAVAVSLPAAKSMRPRSTRFTAPSCMDLK